MKKSTSYAKWLCMIVMIVLGAVQANAQDPYLEDFSSITYANKLPEGWACKGDISNFEYETDKYHTGVGSGKKALAVHPTNTENYLITPKLAAGSIAFYLRQYSKSYAASAALYYCTEKDGEFTIGAQIGTTATLAKANSPAWTKFTYTLAQDSRIAILFDGVFDDFVAPMGIAEEGGEEGGGEGTDPENPGTDPEPQPEPEKHLQITAFSRTSDWETNADENNQFSATFKVTVKNTGNVELTAEEVSVSITDAYTEGYKALATATAAKALAAGESADITLEATNLTTEKEGYVYFYAKENLENTFFKSAYGTVQSTNVYVNPYVAKFAIYAEGAYSQLSSSSTVDFGSKVTTTVSKNFEIRNAGAAPLEVSSITVPEGFTVDPSSFTVAGGSKQTFTVSLVPEADNYGEFSGNVVITHALGTFSFPVKGTTIDPDNVMIDFEDGKIPENWAHDNNFKTSSYYKYGYNFSSTPSYFTSPRIVIKEGKALSFKAEKGSSSYTPVLTLSYSVNGRDWTEVKNFSSELTTSFQTFVVDEIPAGKWFIKFEGKYFDIDDITGFSYSKELLVPIAIASTGYATFAPQQNVTLTEDINAYIVKSYNNGEAYVTLSPISGIIAQGEGIIVEGEPNTIIDVETTEEAAEKNAENILVGTLAATPLAEGEAYILVEEEGQAVFSLCAAGTIAAGKAYLPASVANAAPSLKIVMEDDATAIDSLTTAKPQNRTTAVYNLAGQKVSTGYKGIIIRNGKKMMVK